MNYLLLTLTVQLLATFSWAEPTASDGSCRDIYHMCPFWRRHNFCNRYEEMGRRYCTKSCRKCGETSGMSGEMKTSDYSECNAQKPCKSGYSCQYIRNIPGQKYCIQGSGVARRPGRCPLPDEPAATNTKCEYSGQCGSGQKCCLRNDGNAYCLAAAPVDDTSPKYTILLPGVFRKEAGAFVFVGTVTLVQSKGKNILFDTAGPAEKMELLGKLQDLTGLYPEDIDFVVTSHGHMDHYGNAGLFPDTPNNFDSFLITGNQFAGNALAKKQRLYIDGDPDLEIIQSPGHTTQDTTLVLYNVPGKGRVALTGDLFLTPDDYKNAPRPFNEEQSGSRKRVACEFADWIVPGHGSEFQVTREVKASFGC